MENRQVVTPCE